MKLNNTIELVGYGHPDRFADYLAELILERNLEQDKEAKVAVEILATKNSISLGGEITSTANVDYTQTVYDAIERVYGEKWWPNYKEVKVFNHIEKQSSELSTIQEEGIVAGDQGVVYGYYNRERFAIIKELYKLMDLIKDEFDIAPDWKLLYTPETKELSMSVCGDVNHSSIKVRIEQLREKLLDLGNGEVIVNPKGEWLIPGPLSDTGVVGRKLMIDTFGAGIPHGGGAFCGKDPSKVDKTGIIWASMIARRIGIYYNQNETIVELNFKIGDAEPTMFADGIKQIPNGVTLNEFIKEHNLKEEKWSEHVLNGGVLSVLGEI